MHKSPYSLGSTQNNNDCSHFATSLTRDAYRQSLVHSISNCFNSVVIGNPLIYEYDDLSRPVWRNGDTFAYNARGEVVAASVASNDTNYAYDGVGNYNQVSRNQEEITYSSNELNQYTEISSSNNVRQLVYDANGNLVSNGVYSLAYDCENKLTYVSSNGVLLLTNCYDAKSRRVQKVTSQATHTFFYDDWNLIEERIVHTNGTSTVIEYVWGQDFSGTLQGSGGVGGLLYLKRNGEIFIPTYDNNGNILSYVDANGTKVASYTYDAFGKTLTQTGDLATTFNHRFSTKYYDNESRLYYYGYRFYVPPLGRWLNRDPLEEDGGVNLYGFVRNASPYSFDYLGEEVRVVFHLPGDGFLSEWEIAGYAAMTVFYGSKPYKETIGPDSSGKIKFRVILKPPIATINVYFRRGLSGWQAFRARAAEMQHIESYIKYDKAVEAFKRAVERIYDCPNAANEKYARLYSELEKTASATIKYNKEYLDGHGGIHGH